MTQSVQKLCVYCGIDVSHQKRVKDQQGRYYCHPCWNENTTTPSATSRSAVASPDSIIKNPRPKDSETHQRHANYAGGHADAFPTGEDAVAADAISVVGTGKPSAQQHRLILGGAGVLLVLISLSVYFFVERKSAGGKEIGNRTFTTKSPHSPIEAGETGGPGTGLKPNQQVSTTAEHTIQDDGDTQASVQEQAMRQLAAQQAILQQQEVARRQTEESKRIKFASLIQAIRSELRENHCEDALKHCKQAIGEQPSNTEAIGLLKDTCAQVVSSCPFVQVATWKAHDGFTTAIAVTSDGKRIITGTNGKQLKRESATGSRSQSPNAQKSGSNHPTTFIEFWDGNDQKLIKTISDDPTQGGREFVSFLSLSSDESRLLCSYGSGGVRIYDMHSGKPTIDFGASVESSLETPPLTFSPSGQFIVSAGDMVHALNGSENYDYPLRIWELGTGKLARSFVGHKSPVGALAISPDGTLLASGEVNGSFAPIYIWDTRVGGITKTIVGTKADPDNGHRNGVVALRFSDDGKCLMSAGDETIRKWAVGTGQPLNKTPPLGYGYELDRTIFLPDGERAVTTRWEVRETVATPGQSYIPPSPASLQVQDIATGKTNQTLWKDEQVWQVSSSEDGRTIAAVARSGKIGLWSMKPETPLQKEACALITSIRNDEKAAVLMVARTSGVEAGLGNSAQTGEAVASEKQRNDAYNTAYEAKQAELRAESARRKAEIEQQELLHGPLGAANAVCEKLVEQGTILDGHFADSFSWNRGLQSGPRPPKNATRVLVSFVFHFKTQAGLDRTNSNGYFVVDSKGGVWTVISLNIDGEERDWR